MVSSFSVVTAAAALLLGSSPLVAASKPLSLVWDGRIPAEFSPKDLDTVEKSPFNTQFNKGKSQCHPTIRPCPSKELIKRISPTS